MSYSVVILRRAQQELERLPVGAYARVRESIRALSAEPRPRCCRKLAHQDGWRIRVGDYRVLYASTTRRRTVTVLHVGHRRDVYR